jgi:hypothetical protein
VANYRLGSTRGPEMDLYHFIDFPKEANTYDQQRDCKLRNCIIEAIRSYLSVLSSLDDPRMRSVLLCVRRAPGRGHSSTAALLLRRPGGEGEYGPGSMTSLSACRISQERAAAKQIGTFTVAFC